MVELLDTIKKSLVDKTNLRDGHSLGKVTSDLRKLYAWQMRSDEYGSLLKGYFLTTSSMSLSLRPRRTD